MDASVRRTDEELVEDEEEVEERQETAAEQDDEESASGCLDRYTMDEMRREAASKLAVIINQNGEWRNHQN